VSRQLVRGNDNNRHQPDGVNFLGPGEIAGYAIFNMSLDYRLDRGLRAFAKLSNVFDRRYATAGALRQNFFPAAAWPRRAPRSTRPSTHRARRAPVGRDTARARRRGKRAKPAAQASRD